MIDIIHVSKTYPKQQVKAVDDVSLHIDSGEFFGLLGPNGAGKTPLIRILVTLLLPTSGEVQINNQVLTRKRADLKKKLSIITQENSLRYDMTLDQVMEWQARLYHIPLAVMRERREELLDFCGLTEHRKKTVRKLSGGMKRKLMLCRALLTDPEILILDEPTIGLDPASRRQMWDLLRRLNEKGLTVLMTTHYIEEAQSLCQRVALINKGKVVRLDTPAELISQLGPVAVDEFDGSQTRSSFFPTKEEALAYAESITNKFNMRSTTLEDVFLDIVGSGLEVV